jgi:hypothetical protein
MCLMKKILQFNILVEFWYSTNFKIVYKTLPGTPISSVQLGGALHSLQNKTFIATRTEVKG